MKCVEGCLPGLYLLLLLLLVSLVAFGVIIRVCVSVKEACWKVFINYERLHSLEGLVPLKGKREAEGGTQKAREES